MLNLIDGPFPYRRDGSLYQIIDSQEMIFNYKYGYFRHGTIGLIALGGVCAAVVGGIFAKYSQVRRSVILDLILSNTL